MRESLSAIGNYEKLGLLIQSGTLAGIASEINLDEKVLEESLERYNGFQACGEDADFNRSATQMPVPLTKAPFFMPLRSSLQSITRWEESA